MVSISAAGCHDRARQLDCARRKLTGLNLGLHHRDYPLVASAIMPVRNNLLASTPSAWFSARSSARRTSSPSRRRVYALPCHGHRALTRSWTASAGCPIASASPAICLISGSCAPLILVGQVGDPGIDALAWPGRCRLHRSGVVRFRVILVIPSSSPLPIPPMGIWLCGNHDRRRRHHRPARTHARSRWDDVRIVRGAGREEAQPHRRRHRAPSTSPPTRRRSTSRTCVTPEEPGAPRSRRPATPRRCRTPARRLSCHRRSPDAGRVVAATAAGSRRR